MVILDSGLLFEPPCKFATQIILRESRGCDLGHN